MYGAALQKSYEYAKKGEKFPFEDFGYDSQGTKYWGNYLTAGSYVSDEKMRLNGTVWPYNVTRRFSGRCNVRKALQQSINTCAVKIQRQVGAEYSAEMLKKFGITTVVEEGDVNDMNPAAMALGAMTYGITPLEASLAYAAFPNDGVRNTPVCYTKVEDSEGNVILEGTTEEIKVMDKGVAWIMTDMLKSVVSRGIAGSAYVSGTQVGGKTGTTNDRYDIWFDGFTPKYSAALWIGADKNHQLSSGSDAAARLWSRIMSQIPGVTDGEYSSMPSNVVLVNGEYYTRGTEQYYSYYDSTAPKKKSSSKKSSSKKSSSSGSGSSSGSSSGSASKSKKKDSDDDIWE